MKRALKPQSQKLTVFAFCEGQTEKALLRHIKISYKNNAIHVIVDCANGSTPEVIINYAIKVCPLISSKGFVLLDIDKPWEQKLEEKAKKEKNIDIVGASPCCIEGFLLTLLETKFKSKHTLHTKGDCKRIFHEKYLNDKEKLDHRNYQKILPKEKLEKLGKKNKVLDRIIQLMTTLTI